MASMIPNTDQSDERFTYFLKERSTILEDIKQFLFVVLLFYLDMEYRVALPTDVIASERLLSQLIESLCLIHGLYGYPAPPADSETDPEKSTEVKIDAVKDMLLNKIKEKQGETTITFVHYCKKVRNNEFWQFQFINGTSNLEGSLREPAHIFLQMVRDLFKRRKVTEVASDTGRKVLESLHDNNLLKPKVWAEHEERHDCYGVSLGVRRIIRPLYLYIKMNKLRNVENDYDGVKLENVKAFQMLKRKNMKNPKASEYKKDKKACLSCKIFFNVARKHEGSDGSFSPFANCAEYDVIRTRNLQYVLDYIKGDWEVFKSACKRHFEAFNKMTQNLNKHCNQSQNEKREEILKTYCTNTRDAKILQYEWDGLSRSYQPRYRLAVKNWPYPTEDCKENKKTKRRKTGP